jgi:hypothetical protein
MLRRKFFLVFVLLAGLFAFQGSLAFPVPQEKVRTEIVLSLREEKVVHVTGFYKAQVIHLFREPRASKAQVSTNRLLSLIISYQQHHSSL